jgi:uncharacterized protein (DUF2336 family)
MLVRAYLEWMSTAAIEERVQAVSVMTHTFISGCLSADDQADAEAALLLALDDGAVLVRRALAQGLASSEFAPRSIVLGLAQDVSMVAAHVLLKSPVLVDADLVDVIITGDAIAQTAIALRPALSAPLAVAIARHGSLDAALALVSNDGAEVPPEAFLLIAERHKASAELRGVLLEREDLPLAVRQMVVAATSAALREFAVGAGWLGAARAERCIADAERQATIEVVAMGDDREVGEVVHVLRSSERLTASLLLRAVLGGDTRLMQHALSQLANMPANKVKAMLWDASGSAFSALFNRAQLPASLKSAFVAAIKACNRLRTEPGSYLNIHVIQATLIAVSQEKGGGDAAVLALLRRYEADAKRVLARAMTQEIMGKPARILDNAAEIDAVIAIGTDIAADASTAVPPSPHNDIITITPGDRLQPETKKAA